MERNGIFKISDYGDGIRLDTQTKNLTYSGAKILAKQILRMVEKHELKIKAEKK